MLKKDVINTLKYLMFYKADPDTDEKQALDYAIRVLEKYYKEDNNGFQNK